MSNNPFIRNNPNTNYFIDIDGEIDENNDYDEMIDLLECTSSLDTVNILLSSEGGCCRTAARIIAAIKKCNCPVHISLLYPCYSAAALIALSGTSLTFSPHTFLMFHDYSMSRGYEKGGDALKEQAHFRAYYNQYFLSIVHPFLSIKECHRIFKSEDIYISADDKTLQHRLIRHFSPLSS